MGSWKKFIMGEKMPDKDDPQYKEKYEKDVDAGRRFARWSGLDRLAANVQDFANKHTKAFLIIVFGFVILSFGMNIYRMGRVWSPAGRIDKEPPSTCQEGCQFSSLYASQHQQRLSRKCN